MQMEMQMRTLEERLAAGKPEAWKPEKPGDSIVGEIEDITTIVTDFGPSPVTTILREDGSAVNVAWFGGVLKGKFDSLAPAVGMKVALQYLGTKPSKTKGHADYKDWYVLLDETTRPAGSQPVRVATAGPAADGATPDDFEESF